MADWGWLGSVGKWLGTAAETAKKYQPLIKTGVAALSTYASWKDQQKKNEMQQAAYDDWMAQAAEAGHEAQAAVDINLTPMTVSGTPTTKADITDFTPVAKGGLMTLPNKQRKRYYAGTGEDEVIETEEEVLSPLDLQQETGLDLMGEQVKYNTGNPREGAYSVWNSGAIDQEIYDFDFEIFFDSGDWSDMLKGQVDVQENMQMASADPMLQDEYDKYLFEIQEQGGTPMSIEQFRDQAVAGQANGGIIGLRHGGRPGYDRRIFVEDQETMAQSITLPDGGEEVVTDSMTEIEGQTAGSDIYIQRIDHLLFNFPELSEEEAEAIAFNDEKYYEKLGHDPYAQGGRIGYSAGTKDSKEKNEADKILKRIEELQDMGLDLMAATKKAREEAGYNQGGRIGYAQGSGIMNLGGMEKDYRTTGGFVPIGAYEKKDDVPARLSKNEFVMTADAVRAAGGGSINKGAQLMYDTMKNLEASPQAKRMTA